MIKKATEYIEAQQFRQEPDCYDGKTCDKLRPRWMTDYPKEGTEEHGDSLSFEMPANEYPPGTRITIEVPCCPKCGDRADMNSPNPGKPTNEWPDCDCGFSWNQWAIERFS